MNLNADSDLFRRTKPTRPKTRRIMMVADLAVDGASIEAMAHPADL